MISVYVFFIVTEVPVESTEKDFTSSHGMTQNGQAIVSIGDPVSRIAADGNETRVTAVLPQQKCAKNMLKAPELMWKLLSAKMIKDVNYTTTMEGCKKMTNNHGNRIM